MWLKSCEEGLDAEFSQAGLHKMGRHMSIVASHSL